MHVRSFLLFILCLLIALATLRQARLLAEQVVVLPTDQFVTTTPPPVLTSSTFHDQNHNDGAGGHEVLLPPPPPPILWMTSCETRNMSIPWFETAKILQRTSSMSPTPVEVRMANICEGAKWIGFMTKTVNMEKFLIQNVVNSTNTASIVSQHRRRKTYVLFADSDVLLNVWAIPHVSMILEKFHTTVSPGGHSVVIGAEPNCWMGRFCQKSDYENVYPNVPNRTSCPVFLNSGLYMGEADTVFQMIEAVLDKSNEPKYTSLIKKILMEKRRNRNSEQSRVAAWYSLNRHLAVLDTQASMFRNLYFGTVDASIYLDKSMGAKDPNSCGPNGIESCGFFDPYISGIFNTSSHEIIMDPVPSCETDPKPLFIHGNGKTKATMNQLGDQMYAASTIAAVTT